MGSCFSSRQSPNQQRFSAPRSNPQVPQNLNQEAFVQFLTRQISNQRNRNQSANPSMYFTRLNPQHVYSDDLQRQRNALLTALRLLEGIREPSLSAINNNTANNNHSSPTGSQFAQQLPSRAYRKNQSNIKNADEDFCVICLQQFKEQERVVSYPCIHTFHPQCSQQWLGKSTLCPICKYNLQEG